MLVSCTDGVGTKLKLAVAAGVHDTVGIDLVAMSVNDLLCTGAEPLFFLDYVAMSHGRPAAARADRRGHRRRLRGERLRPARRRDGDLPDLYQPGDYDLAGFCVGVVERKRLDRRQADRSRATSLIGIASSGLHSNGYSLVRKVVFEMAGLTVDRQPCRSCGGQTLGEAAARADPALRPGSHGGAAATTGSSSVVHGIAHITGGGLRREPRPDRAGRTLQVVSTAAAGRCRRSSAGSSGWARSSAEMDRVFNMGIGMVLVVSPHFADSIRHQLADLGHDHWQIGTVRAAATAATRVVDARSARRCTGAPRGLSGQGASGVVRARSATSRR